RGPGELAGADALLQFAEAERTRAAAQPAPSAAPAAAGAGGGSNVQGLNLLKPPYGTITAINLDKGDIVWQIPHGETPDFVRNHPALKGLNIPRTGQGGTAGT